MSNDFNSCTFTGRLSKDPDVRYLPDGKVVTNFSIACGESWKDKNTGEKKERVEWIRVVCFNKLAEIAGEFLLKGSQVLISGKLTTRSWDDKDGNKRYSTEIIADKMQMLGGKKKEDAGDQAASPGEHAPNEVDDIPF